MPRASRQNPAIRDFILENVSQHPGTVASLAAKQFGLSRTAVGRYLKRLVDEGILKAEGRTNARRYALLPLVNECFRIELAPGLAEDAVWRFRIVPMVSGVPQNVVDICQYGFTEMLNNAIDHSESADAIISYQQDYNTIKMNIIDHGIGIFEKIQRDFNLADPRSALLELSKGKLTSNKKLHSGEGIFYTSRMFERFQILSGKLFYTKTRQEDDGWLIETEDKIEYTKGTYVAMHISTKATRTTKEIFEKYQGDNIFFRRTHVPIKLGRYPGEQLVSRSQAKRILARFDDFSEVILDFSGVGQIGQPFADEIFRVFKNAHPHIGLIAIHTSPEINAMIEYVETAGKT